MDPLSTTASIIAILQLAGTVVRYLNSVKDAPKERENIFREISSITGVLYLVKDHAEREDSPPGSIQTISVPHGPLAQFQATLEALAAKFSSAGVLKKLGRNLTWPFEKSEIVGLLQSLERLKTYFILALESDHIDLTKKTQATIDKLSDTVEWLRLGQDEEECRRILDWLSATDAEQKQQDVHSRYHKGTCAWFFKSKEYTDWLTKDGANPLLWCLGNPGAGKTVIMSLVVDQIRTEIDGEDIGIAFAYCQYNDPKSNTATSVLASLARQLAMRSDALHRKVDEMFRKLTKGKKTTKPSARDLLGLLPILAMAFKHTFIFVDGIDECEKKERSMLLSMLKDLASLDGGHVRVFATSRPHAQDIYLAFKSAACLEIIATEDDIELFVRHQLEASDEIVELIEVGLEQDDGMNANLLYENIVSLTAKQASGMFLMAVLQMERICTADSLGEITDALASMPADLFDLYGQSLEIMSKQPPLRYERGLRVLSWVSRASRPLLVDEILHALVAEDADAKQPPAQLDRSRLIQPKKLVDVCAGLVIIDPQSKVVRLVHATVQEYLDQLDVDRLALADERIARACLTYLAFDEFAKGPCLSDESLENRLKDFPFLDYSACFWGHHLRNAANEGLQDIALALFRDEPRALSINQAFHRSRLSFPDYSQLYPKHVIPLHLAAHFGLFRLLDSLLKDSVVAINSTDSFGWTALHRAAENGHEDVVRLLLERGCNLQMAAKFGGTALHRAAKNGHAGIVQLLLDAKADVDAEDNYGGTPLHRAARHGHDKVVRLLLARGADLNRIYNFEAILRLMMEDGTIVISQIISESFRHIPHWRNSDPIFRQMEIRLVSRDRRRGTRDDLYEAEVAGMERLRGGSALHEAAGAGHIGLVQLLIDEASADIEIVDTFGASALHRAARNGHDDVIEVLLHKGAFVNGRCGRSGAAEEFISISSSRPGTGSLHWNSLELQFDVMLGTTPLCEAAANGHTKAVRVLLDRGADANIPAAYSGSPLQMAARNGHAEVITTLLDGGANVDQCDQISMKIIKGTALHEAANRGHETLASLLLHAGANVNGARALDKIKIPPLFQAVKGAHLGLARVLIEEGAELCANGRTGRATALSIAAEIGDAAMIQLLLDNGADQINEHGMTHLIREFIDTGLGSSFSPLSRAASRGHAEVVRLLLLHGADANGEYFEYFGGPKVLKSAIRARSSATVNELVLRGADPNVGSTTILLSALKELCQAIDSARANSKEDHCTEVELAAEITRIRREFEIILQDLMRVNADASMPDQASNMTALHLAARDGHMQIAALLIANGADINAIDRENKTPLFYAAETGDESMTEFLLSMGSRPDLGLDPLYGAACSGSGAVAELLLQNAADVSQSNNLWVEILHNAAQNGIHCIVEALIENADDFGNSEDAEVALCRAAAAGHTSVVKLLARHGAQLEPKAEWEMNFAEGSITVRLVISKEGGITPLLLSTISGHEETALALLEMGADPDQTDPSTGRQLLSWAAGNGMTRLTRLLLDHSIQVDTPDLNTFTPLSWAAKNGHSAVVQFLLDQGAKPDGSVRNFLSMPVCLAAGAGHLEIVRLLADAGGDVTGTDLGDEHTPLEQAVHERHPAVVRELLDRIADNDTQKPPGTPSLLASAASSGVYETAELLLNAGVGTTEPALSLALLAAAEKGHLRLVQLLLRNGAPANFRPEGAVGPLLLAARAGNDDMVEILLTAGAHIEVAPALHALIKKGRLAMTRRLLPLLDSSEANSVYQERTLLGRAAQKGYEDVVRALISRGANVDAEDANSACTALLYAAREGHARVVDLLLARTKGTGELTSIECLSQGLHHESIARRLAEVGSPQELREAKSGRLLAIASSYGQERVVRILLEKGLEANLDGQENQPLHSAASRGYLPVVRLLLTGGADLEARDTKDGRSALSLAVEFGHDSIVQLLLEHNANTESHDNKDSSTPLHWAAKKGRQVATHYLVERGARVEARTNNGRTPLLVAADNGNSGVAKLLLDHGADVEASGPDGRTPLHLAAANGYQTLARILRLHDGTDANMMMDASGQTPIALAKANRHLSLVKLLQT